MINILTTISHAILPLTSFILLAGGLRRQQGKYVLAALWLSMISVVLQYQDAGGEILGSYFDYQHASLYSITLLILLTSLIWLLWKFAKEHGTGMWRPLIGLLVAMAITGTLLLMINLWINARFVESRQPGSPILQVGSFQKLDYCGYRYLFYVVNRAGDLTYLCPDYYGLLPSVGKLNNVPDFISRQLPSSLQTRFKPQKP